MEVGNMSLNVDLKCSYLLLSCWDQQTDVKNWVLRTKVSPAVIKPFWDPSWTCIKMSASTAGQLKLDIYREIRRIKLCKSIKLKGERCLLIFHSADVFWPQHEHVKHCTNITAWCMMRQRTNYNDWKILHEMEENCMLLHVKFFLMYIFDLKYECLIQNNPKIITNK